MIINTVTHALVAGKVEAEHLEDLLVTALHYAQQAGLVVTIENRALPPLAQGNHAPWITIAATKEVGMKLEAIAKEGLANLGSIGTTLTQKIENETKSVGSEIAAAIKKDFDI